MSGITAAEKATAFSAIYNQSRNGANGMFRHPLCRRLIYSDGVRDLAESGGCFWLLDVIGTEVVSALRGSFPLCILKVKVSNGKADLSLTDQDDKPPVWKRHIDYTDMPVGEWTFYITSDGRECTLILPSEY